MATLSPLLFLLLRLSVSDTLNRPGGGVESVKQGKGRLRSNNRPSWQWRSPLADDAAAPLTTIEALSLSPPVFHVRDMFSAAEVDALKAAAAPNLRSSETRDTAKSAELRVSTSYFFEENDVRKDTTLLRLRRRMLSLAAFPPFRGDVRVGDLPEVVPEHCEKLQIQRYAVGDHYRAHHDYDDKKVAYGRSATLLVYLEAPAGGGETVFPSSTYDHGAGLWHVENASKAGCEGVDENCPLERMLSSGTPYCCCAEVLKIPPRNGDAVLFFPALPSGKMDMRMFHGSCPVTTGEKWTAQQWFHQRRPAKPLRSCRRAGLRRGDMDGDREEL